MKKKKLKNKCLEKDKKWVWKVSREREEWHHLFIMKN